MSGTPEDSVSFMSSPDGSSAHSSSQCRCDALHPGGRLCEQIGSRPDLCDVSRS